MNDVISGSQQGSPHLPPDSFGILPVFDVISAVREPKFCSRSSMTDILADDATPSVAHAH